jgi:hypothetical protein
MADSQGPGTAGATSGGRSTQEIKVSLPQEVAAGVYTNGMLVQHTDDEFVMDFTMVVGGQGTVVSRVITSPAHMKRIVVALQENLRRYEATHGAIKAHDSQPKMRLGFQPPEE